MLEDLLKGNFIPKGEPFYNKASKEFGVLMLHGLARSPYQVKELGDYLYGKGISNFGAVTVGHATKIEDLAKTTRKEWLDSVRNAYEEFAKTYQKRIILGFSLGGLLALNLAKEYNPDGVISLSAFYNINVKGNLKYLVGLNKLHPEEKVGYPSMPVKSMYEIVNLVHETRRITKEIESPILIIQGTKDERVNENAAYELYSHVGSKHKDIMMLKDEEHIILKGDYKQKIFNRVHDFILQCV